MTARLVSFLALVVSSAPMACGAGSAPAAPAASAHAHATPAGAAPRAWSAPFVASRERPFGAQMMETMDRMDDGMVRAPMNGAPDHDFVTMMIPHHQGGIDMAKVLLVQGTDPEMRRLAQAIVTDQQNEIELMRLWLERHPEAKETAR